FRFGALSDQTRETLDHASPELIRAWALRVLSASSIEEVFMVDPASHAAHEKDKNP
ncbi:MAG: hypothetical protein HY898_09550, partial [Deltaproteobacteria bacterium]|nr:hypothetical protein [Deltaproteobacteria bacterium]